MTERLADRIARTFGGFDRTQAELPEWEDRDMEYGAAAPTEQWEQEPDRFPVSRHGYDRDAVDQHVDALERELAELRERGRAGTVSQEVSEEIKRIGEQTAAILQAAHEQAHITRREAHSEADRCLTDAAANAVSITEEAHQRLRRLDADTDHVWRERGRLIEDVRAVATALISVADEAATRFPAEPEPAGRPVPVRAGVTEPVAPEAEQPEDDGFAGLA